MSETGAGIGTTLLKVAVVVSDFYARHAISAYLAWDRRTRVVGMYARLDELHAKLDAAEEAPDAVVIDAIDWATAGDLRQALGSLRARLDGLIVLCLAPIADLDYLYAAVDNGAAGYLLESDARIHIAWALCYAARLADDEFLVSAGVADEAAKLRHQRLKRTRHLPQPIAYPEMTPRILQAIELFAVEGMPQKLVAYEMGISEHTARDYITQAYKILDACHEDESDYPVGMNRQEIAYMRLTALDIPAD